MKAALPTRAISRKTKAHVNKNISMLNVIDNMGLGRRCVSVSIYDVFLSCRLGQMISQNKIIFQ